MPEAQTPLKPRPTEDEVRQRLRYCTDGKVVDELYTFGQTLSKDTLEQIKTIEIKATSFAAYGTAVATLLVTNSSKLTSGCAVWLAFFAGLLAFACTWFSVSSLFLTTLRTVSPQDWLKQEVWTSIDDLKRYRVLSLWQVIDSRIAVQASKSKAIGRAQILLVGSVAYLATLLLQVAAHHTDVGWIAGTFDVQGSQCGQRISEWHGLLLYWGAVVIPGLITIAALFWRTRRRS